MYSCDARCITRQSLEGKTCPCSERESVEWISFDSSVLTNCFVQKISEIANAFHQALHMTEDERMRRISTASEFVTRVTTQRWALAVMLDLKGVHKNINPIQYSGAGLGLGFRLLGMDVGFKSLDFNSIAKAFKNSRSRLILLDYGGTIVSNDNVSFDHWCWLTFFWLRICKILTRSTYACNFSSTT